MNLRSLFRETASLICAPGYLSGERYSRSLCLLFVSGFLLVSPLAAQTFKNPRFLPTATDPSTISQGDFNGDGKADLAYLDGGFPPVLHVLLGKGDGTFQRGQDVPLPLGTGGKITLADINRDGKLDVVLGGGGPQAQLGVLLGNENGTFQPLIMTQFPVAGSAFAHIGSLIGVADFNGDGAVDLAAADTLNSAVYILLGNGSGSFTLKSTLFNGSGPTNIFTGDFNGDGHADILVQGTFGADATVYRGNGDGTFQTGTRYTGPHNITSVLLRDMNGDGRPDMVVTGFNNTIDILQGNADGTFATASSGGTSNGGPGASLLAVFDFNSDGILDIAAAGSNGISILLGQGNLSYAPPVPYSGSPTPGGAVMADFNGDGFQDFAELAPGGLALVFGAAGGTLQGADLYDLGEGLNGIAVADFNGDQIPDIAVNVAEPTPRLLIGKGGGKFSVAPSASQTSSASSTFLATGDFNGDGKADLLQTGSTSGPQVFFGNGNGTFGVPIPVTTPAQNSYGDVLIADFNRDGITDIAALDYQSLDVLLGQRNDTFKVLSNSFFSLSNSNGAATGDFNNDGKLDLVVTQDEANPLQILLGQGDGTFQFARQLPALNLPQAIVTGDLNGDGRTDIVACFGFFNIVQIFYGNGDGSFQDPVNLRLQRGYTQMAIADMNGDGRPDLVFSDGAMISVILNLGGRAFGAEEHYLAGAIASFVVKDVNGDGLPDIIVANGGTGNGFATTTVTVLLNQGAANTVAGQLRVSPEPSPYGQPFTLSLSLAPQGTNPPAPSGNVAISIDDVPLATIPVTGLNLTYTDGNSPSLPVGVHTIVAAYSGDPHYLASTFTVQHQIVPVLYPTSTTLTATPAQALASQTIRFTATVTSPGQNVNAPNGLSGTVVFRDGTTNLGTGTVGAGGVAVFDTALLGAGVHSVTANYLGYTAVFQQTGSFAPSTSPPVSVSVTANPTNTNLTVLPPSVPAGGTVSLTATVTSASGTPTGAVTFLDGSLPLSAQPLDGSGSAVFSPTFGSVGTHLLKAVYQANASFASSTSPQVSLTVNSPAQTAQSSVQLAAVPSPQLTDGVLLTATVTAKQVIPTGKVAFLDGTTRLGDVSLNGQGAATYSFAVPTPGLHYLVAYYPGNSSLHPSISSVLIERAPVQTSDFLLTLADSSLAIPQGRSIPLAVTVSPINGFNREVSLSCAFQAPGPSCRFEHMSLPNGRGTSMLMISADQIPSSSSHTSSKHLDLPGNLLGLTVFSCVIILALAPSRRRPRLSLALLLCVLLVAGCGSLRTQQKPILTPAGTYLLTVTGITANSSGRVAHEAQVQVTVQPSLN